MSAPAAGGCRNVGSGATPYYPQGPSHPANLRDQDHMDAAIRQHELPLPLRMIPDPPPRLHCRGSVAVLEAPAVAIVGSRRCTRQGADIAFALGRDLAVQGLAIVSGLAYGIDTAAHRGALAVAGTTIAVLGGGLGRIYPRSNEDLAAQIVASGGALVTEHPPDAAPRKHHFPARNRIVSGLCLGVVIVEASDRSGSLITARMALEQGREVMAVPSSVASPLSHGCHRLIRDGAALVECAEHVLEALGIEPARTAPDEAAPQDDPVFALVDADVTPLERIVAGSGLAMEAVLERLAELEIDGRVRSHGGGYMRAAG